MLTSTPIPTLYQCGHIRHRPLVLTRGRTSGLDIVMWVRNNAGETRDCPDCDPPKEKR